MSSAPLTEAAPDRGITQLEIDQRVFDLYDEYCHGRIDRREFLARAAGGIGGPPPSGAASVRRGVGRRVS